MASPFDTAKSAILGVPVDPNKKPSRTGIVQAFSEMQSLVSGAAMGALIKNSLAALTATTSAPSAGAMAWVIGDTTPANNGIYENTGTVSAAVWTRRADIPIGMITAINVGAGTANAIQVATDLPVPSADGKCIVALPIVATNTSATVTISINGGAALTVSRNYGTALAVGDLVAGVFYLGIIAGGQFRLINPARDVVETLPPDGSITAAKMSPTAVVDNLGYIPARTTVEPHPLTGTLIELLPSAVDTHFWIYDVVYESVTGRTIVIYSRTAYHAFTPSAVLCSRFTEDGGNTWSSEKVIFTFQNVDPRFVVAGAMDSGRVGLVLFGQLAADAWYFFIKTDNGGDTWTQNEFTTSVGANGINFHSAMIKTGTGQFDIWGHGGLPQEIRRLRITGNGTGFAISRITNLTNGDGFTEPTVVKHDSGKFTMFIRDAAASESDIRPMLVSHSSDGNTWSNAVSVATMLVGANPLAAIPYEVDGNCYLYLCSRGGYQIEVGGKNFVYMAKMKISDLELTTGVPSGTAWGKVFSLPDRATGYLRFCKRDGNTLAVVNAGEGPDNSNSTIVSNMAGFFITPSPVAVASPWVRKIESRQNEAHHGIIHEFSRGTSFSGASVIKYAPRWVADGNGQNLTVNFPGVDDKIRLIVPGHPEYATSLVAAGASTHQNIAQYRFGPEEVSKYTDVPIWFDVWLSGTIPTNPRAYVVINYGTGGSASVAASGAMSLTAVPYYNGVFRLSGFVTAPTRVGKTVTADASVKFMLWFEDSGTTTATIYSVGYARGSVECMLDPADYSVEKQMFRSFCNRIVLADNRRLAEVYGTSATAADGTLSFPTQMRAEPAISLLSGFTAANVLVNGGAVSTVAFSEITRQSAKLAITKASGLVANTRYPATSSAAGLQILLDAE